MRLLHVLPTATDEHARSLATAQALVVALAERGHACRTWKPEGTRDSAVLELRALDLSDVELVHNHAGLWALACLPAETRPVVSSLYDDPCAAERAWLDGLEHPPTLLACGIEPRDLLVAGTLAAEQQLDESVATLEAVYAQTLERWRTQTVDSRFDERPWGRYWVLDDQPTFKVKRITVDPGGRLSYQRHQRRGEHWIFVAGRAKVTLDGVDLELGAGDDIRIPAGAAHRVQNLGAEPATFVEIQSGDYFGEDDIERLSDDYGRAGE